VQAVIAFGFFNITQAGKEQNRVLAPAEFQGFLLELRVFLAAQFIPTGISPIQLLFAQGVHKRNHPPRVHAAAAGALDVRFFGHRADHRHVHSRLDRQDILLVFQQNR